MRNSDKTLYCQSQIEKKFVAMINDKNIKVVSFDIFDTLAFRKVATPADIFYKVGKKKYVKDIFHTPDAFKLFRIKAESKARSENLHLEDITYNLIYEQLHLNKTQKQTIQKLEIEEEFKNLYINKQVESWIEMAHEKGKKVILISDMYLSKKEIDYLVLSKLKNEKLISDSFLSSEYLKSKAKGGLYPLIKDKLEIDYGEWCHIGDNIHSDVKQARKLDIITLHYSHSQTLQATQNIEKKYINSNIQKVSSLRKLTTVLNPYATKKEKFYFDLAATIYAPAIWNFVHWLKCIAKKENITQINFVMREGKIFQKYFNKIYKDFDTNLIYASRKSIFLSSLDENNFKISDFNYHNYRKITIEDLYSFYKIKITNKILKKHKNILCADASSIIVHDQNLLDILNSDLNKNTDTIKKNIKKEKVLFSDYLSTFNIKQNSIFVDFGGTGTLLEHITNTLHNKNITNVMFYMHADGYKKMTLFKAHSFLPLTNKTHHSIESIKYTPEFTEILFNGIEKTTTHYSYENSLAIAHTELPHKKQDDLPLIVNAFNKGIDTFFRTVKTYKFKKIIDNETIALTLARVMNVPSQDEVKYLGNLYYDEGKGSKLVQKLIPKHGLKNIKKLGLQDSYKEFSKAMYYKRGEFHWLQGIISKIDPTYIASMQGLITNSINENHIKTLISTLKENPHIKNINIYSAGLFLQQLKPELDKLGVKVVSIMDTKALDKEYYFHKDLVTSLEFQVNQGNRYPILIASIAFELEIFDYISKYIHKKSINTSIISRNYGIIKIKGKK